MDAGDRTYQRPPTWLVDVTTPYALINPLRDRRPPPARARKVLYHLDPRRRRQRCRQGELTRITAEKNRTL